MSAASTHAGIVAMLFDSIPPWLLANLNCVAAQTRLVVIAAKADKGIAGLENKFRFDHVSVELGPENSRDRHARFVDRIAATLDRIRPDVVVTTGWSGTKELRAIDWCLRNQVQVIVATDSTARDYPRNAFREMVKRRIVRLLSAGWAAGSLSRAYLMQLGMPGNSIVTGPVDAFDLHHFSEGADVARRENGAARVRLGLPENYFFAACRFSEEKNIPGLLRAYAQYREQAGAGAWHLVLAGDGPLRSQVIRLIDELGLEQGVRLPGHVSFFDMPAYYGLARAFIHASLRDTWGVVVNEAMAASLPVIVSERCGSTPELVKVGRNGYVVNPMDLGQVAQLLWQMQQDTTILEAMGRESRKIIQGWSPEAYATSLLQVVQVAMRQPLPNYKMLDRILIRLLKMG